MPCHRAPDLARVTTVEVAAGTVTDVVVGADVVLGGKDVVVAGGKEVVVTGIVVVVVGATVVVVVVVGGIVVVVVAAGMLTVSLAAGPTPSADVPVTVNAIGTPTLSPFNSIDVPSTTESAAPGRLTVYWYGDQPEAGGVHRRVTAPPAIPAMRPVGAAVGGPSAGSMFAEATSLERPAALIAITAHDHGRSGSPTATATVTGPATAWTVGSDGVAEQRYLYSLMGTPPVSVGTSHASATRPVTAVGRAVTLRGTVGLPAGVTGRENSLHGPSSPLLSARTRKRYVDPFARGDHTSAVVVVVFVPNDASVSTR